MDAPLEFISTDSGGKPQVVERMRHIVCKMDDKPLQTVVIAGPYRSGKSYFMTRLAQRTGEFFPLGKTVQPKTKGLWAWVGPHPTNKDLNLMLIDTEGLGDPEKGRKEHDSWIVILALLLSNVFIFNNKGTIDNDSLNNLRLMAELSDHIRTKSEEGKEVDEDDDFLKHFPIFIWAVRDFTLKKEIDGKPFEDNNVYLQWALTQKRGQKKAIKEANDVKSAIRRFFPEMHCFLFPIPVKDSDLMNNLDEVTEEDLAKGFLDESSRLLRFVYSVKDSKNVKGKGLNGPMFMALVDAYVNAIRNNALPCIENAMDMIAKQENQKATMMALEAFEKQWEKVKFPVSDKDLHDVFTSAQKLALDLFLKFAIFDKEHEEAQKMGLELEKRLQLKKNSNEKASVDVCLGTLSKLCKPIQSKMKMGGYMKKGGYQQYQCDMETLQKKFFATKGLGDERSRVFSDFISKKEAERSSILQADQKLGKAERKAEEERMQRAQEEQRAKAMEKEVERTKQEGKRMEQNFKDAMAKMSRDMKEQSEREKEELRRRIQKEQKESLRLIKEGFDEDAQMLQEQIRSLTKAMERKDEMYLQAQREFQEEMMERLDEQQRRHEREMRDARRDSTSSSSSDSSGGCRGAAASPASSGCIIL